MNSQGSATDGSGQRVLTKPTHAFIEFNGDVARCGSTHLIPCPALGLSGFSAALENRPDQSP